MMTLLVPVRGDKIHVKCGDKIDVENVSDIAALAKFKTQTFPSVYIRIVGGPAETIPFEDIVKINDRDVTFDSTRNLFKTTSIIKRRFPLPQPGDAYQSFKFDGERTIKDVRLMNDNTNFNEIMVCFEDETTDTSTASETNDGTVKTSTEAPEIKKDKSIKWYRLKDLVIRNNSGFEKYYYDYIHHL